MMITIAPELLREILQTFRYQGCERGGLLKLETAADGTGRITGFWADQTPGERTTYRPGAETAAELASLLHSGAAPALIHSHPAAAAGEPDPTVPSSADGWYMRQRMELNRLPEAFLFIASGGLYGYRYVCGAAAPEAIVLEETDHDEA